MSEGVKYWPGKPVTVLVRNIHRDENVPHLGVIVKVGRKYLTISYGGNGVAPVHQQFGIDTRRSTDLYGEAIFMEPEEARIHLERLGLLEELGELREVMIRDTDKWTNSQIAALILAVIKIRRLDNDEDTQS